jgi:Mrp family chromosome partitioning ATPase/capsular polysaccharide biosynthesis protein
VKDPQPLNVDRALSFLRRRGIWIVICMAMAGLAAYGISKSQEKKYTASAAVIFNEDQLTREIAGLPTTATNVLLQQASNLELLDLGNLATKTAAKVGHGLTERDVEEVVSINGSTESNIASVSVTDASAPLAAKIANAYAKLFVAEQGRASSEYFKLALKLVQKQIAALRPGERNGTAGVDLFARAHSLALLAELQPNSVEVVQTATVPAGPSSPTTAKNTVIGLVLGLFLGFGIALLLERIDPRIREPYELAEIYGTQLLGTVPSSPRVAEYSVADGLGPLPEEAEAFQVIRAQLGSFNTDRSPRLVLISSATAWEGKSTVAFHLAGAAAQTGSRVLLIEANFRRPSLAGRLGLADSPNLLEVTAGLWAIEHAAHVSAASYPGEGSLSVIPAGALGVQSAATVIDSNGMDGILSVAGAAYDLVIVDGPDLTGVSDAFLLMAKVDGLVIVGLDGRSRRDTAEDLMRGREPRRAEPLGREPRVREGRGPAV